MCTLLFISTVYVVCAFIRPIYNAEMYESIQIPNQFQFNSAFFVNLELNLKRKKPR